MYGGKQSNPIPHEEYCGLLMYSQWNMARKKRNILMALSILDTGQPWSEYSWNIIGISLSFMIVEKDPLVNSHYGKSPKSHFFHGKTHYFYGHFQQLFVCHYQRVLHVQHAILGGELPTNRGCGLVHPSDLHGISRVNPLKNLG